MRLTIMGHGPAALRERGLYRTATTQSCATWSLASKPGPSSTARGLAAGSSEGTGDAIQANPFSPAPAPFENLVRRCCVRVPTASTTVARYPTFRPTVAAGASFRGSVGRGGFQISRRRGGAIARSRDPGGWSFGGPLIGWKLHRAADWPAVVAAIRSRLSAARRTASCTGRVCVIAVHKPRPGVAMAALKASPVSLKKNGWGSYRDNQES